MTLPYLLRLLCLCFAFFFLLNAACALLVRMFSTSGLRFVATGRAASAANFLLALRLFPFALATLFVVSLCLPSYLRLEPVATAEHVGATSLLFGGLGFLCWGLALARAIRALLLSALHHWRLSRLAEQIFLPEHGCTAVVLDSSLPVLALSGAVRSRLLISRSLLEALSAEELGAALVHENAHRISRDNLKRLLVLLAPDPFPLVNPLRGMEGAWSQLAEWAADDRAVAGSSQRALSLASALLRVARHGAAPNLPYLSTSLLGGDSDLRVRVDRLLQQDLAIPVANTGLYVRVFALFSALPFIAVLVLPATLSFVHEMQELLLR
jgi:Zn-dependent protease with chaperone function